MPLYGFVRKHFAHSLTADRMLDKFDLYWLSDLVYLLKDVQPLVWWPIITALLLYLLLQIFFNGAVLGSLNTWMAEDSFGGFLEHGSRFFGRFFQLFWLTLPAYLVAVLVLPAVVGLFFSGWVENAVNEWPQHIVFLIKTAVMIIAFSWANLLADYAKIALVQNEGYGVLKALLSAARFIVRRFFRSWGLYWLLAVFFLLVSALYMETENMLAARNALLIFTVFLLQQLYMLARYGIKVQFFQAQMEFYLSNRATIN